MRTYSDAKAMAKALRKGLGERNIDLSHSECLELVARQFGLPDWNTLSAKLAPATSSDAPLQIPDGWMTWGTRQDAYDLGIDKTEPHGAALIRCKYQAGDPAIERIGNGFGTLMQSILADAYRGKRLKLAAKLKTVDAEGATIWMRIDGEDGNTLRFDNMEKRAIDGVLRGTNGWSDRYIVLDVPPNAQNINFGFYLRGAGNAWARDFDLSEVSDEIEVTIGSQTHNRTRPVNLDFSARGPEARA